MVSTSFVSNSTSTGRVRATGIHLVISLAIAILAALLVFLVRYPYPYREISDRRELFLIVVVVDVVMGPLMTLDVFTVAKPREELRRDLGIIGVLQSLRWRTAFEQYRWIVRRIWCLRLTVSGWFTPSTFRLRFLTGHNLNCDRY